MRWLIVLALFGLCTALVFLFPHRMMEPGELSEAHQVTRNDCFACHQPFGGLPNERCIACHTVAEIGRDTVHRTEPTLFHEALAEMSCVDCHSEHQGRQARNAMDGFHHLMLPVPVRNDCKRCHATPADELHAKLPPSCSACHDTVGWKPVRAFDHALMARDVRDACASCHTKPADAVHERTVANCSSCHGTSGWRPAQFDHATLTVAERNACATCHNVPTDEFHRNNKENCASCHTTNAWKPSTFDHGKYFRLDGDHNATCATCHRANDYAAYSCYGCHEHTPSKIMSEHREEGIAKIDDCVKCHRSGEDKEDGGKKEGHHGGKHSDDDDD